MLAIVTGSLPAPVKEGCESTRPLDYHVQSLYEQSFHPRATHYLTSTAIVAILTSTSAIRQSGNLWLKPSERGAHSCPSIRLHVEPGNHPVKIRKLPFRPFRIGGRVQSIGGYKGRAW